MHSLINIINTLYLIAVCWAVAIIKINLQQNRTIMQLQPGIQLFQFKIHWCQNEYWCKCIPQNNIFCVQCSLVSVLNSESSYIALLSPTCKPWAVDLSPIIRRCVSQGERSPTSTCLQCNRSGTGLTLQLGSFRIWAVSFRKPGNSPVRSNWTFRRTRKFKTLQKSKDIFWWSPKNKQANIVA